MSRIDYGFYSLLYSQLKDIPINSSVNSSELHTFIRHNGYANKSSYAFCMAMNKLGFNCSSRGSAYWYRVKFPELDERITKEVKKTEAPTLQERLAAQIASGEREAPTGYSDWRAEQDKKEKAEMEQHKALEHDTIANPATVDIVTTEKPYEFEEVETTVKLVGKFGTYKVISNGQTVVDLLVSGTLSDEELRMLSRELDAVYCRARRMSCNE